MTYMTAATEPTSSVNHLNPCQTPTEAYCQERAEFWITIPETGMNTQPASLTVCVFHTDELVRDNGAEIFDVI